jgi:precorrin-2/cobalt-factor-2 C20-methyltransferase
MKTGKLIGIGVGPGDPELITIKAIKVLEKVSVICAPKSSNSKNSLALSILNPILKEIKTDYHVIEPLFPMFEDEKALHGYWEHAADLIAEKLSAGLDVAFVTLGDPSIYSTFAYVSRLIEGQGFLVEMIPGVSSFTGCAASAGISLGEKDEIIVIVPKVDWRLEQILEHADTAVIMKTSRNPDLLEEIIRSDPRDKMVLSVQDCGMKDEKLYEGFAKKDKYLSTTIVKFRGKKAITDK